MHEAVLERDVGATPEETWRALVEPDRLAAWFWPWSPRVDFSPVPGAPYSLEADHPQAGRLAVDGRIMAADRPDRLALTWRFTDEPGATTEVEIRLFALDEGTRVVVRHRRIGDEATAADYATAWVGILDRLAGHLSEHLAAGR